MGLIAAAAASPAAATKVSLVSKPGIVGKGLVADSLGNLWWISGNGTSVSHLSMSGAGLSGTFLLSGVTKLVALTEAAPGVIWAADRDGNQIVRVTPNFHAYPVTTSSSEPYDLVFADGKIWFTEWAGNKIASFDPATVMFNEIPLAVAGSHPAGIAVSGQFSIAFVENTGNKIGFVTTSTGALAEVPIPVVSAFPLDLVASSEGIYFTEGGLNKIGYMDFEEGNFSHTSIPTADSAPQSIALGPDGAYWFTEGAKDQIGRLGSGGITELPIPTVSAAAKGIVRGFRGELWFTAEGAGSLGKIELVVPGDVNGDGSLDVSDVFYLINFLFASGPPPV
jgi:streptogramin lyase